MTEGSVQLFPCIESPHTSLLNKDSDCELRAHIHCNMVAKRTVSHNACYAKNTQCNTNTHVHSYNICSIHKVCVQCQHQANMYYAVKINMFETSFHALSQLNVVYRLSESNSSVQMPLVSLSVFYKQLFAIQICLILFCFACFCEARCI